MDEYSIILRAGSEFFSYPLESSKYQDNVQIQPFFNFGNFRISSEVEFDKQLLAGSAGIIFVDSVTKEKLGSVQYILSLEEDTSHINVYFGLEDRDVRGCKRLRHHYYPQNHRLAPYPEMNLSLIKNGSELVDFKRVMI